MDRTYLTRSEVAERLRVHVATVDRMIADGRLEAVKNGDPRSNGHVRIPVDAVAAYERDYRVEVSA